MIQNKILFTLLFINIISYAQDNNYTLVNEFNNSRVLLFKDGDDIIQVDKIKIIKTNLKSKTNKKIEYNFDSIIKCCYKKIYRNNFDTALLLRNQLNELMERETNLYNVNFFHEFNYLFFRIYPIVIDSNSLHWNKLNPLPRIYILKTDKNFKLLELFLSVNLYISNLYCINAVANGQISYKNDTTLYLPINHRNIQMTTNETYNNKSKSYNTDMDLSFGLFV